MSTAKIAISLNTQTLKRLDDYVKHHVFRNRSQAIQTAIEERIERMEHRRLAAECEKLDPEFEQTLADEGLKRDIKEWPEY